MNSNKEDGCVGKRDGTIQGQHGGKNLGVEGSLSFGIPKWLLEFQDVLFSHAMALWLPRWAAVFRAWLLGSHGGCWFFELGVFPWILTPRFRAVPLVPVVAPSVPGLGCFSVKSKGAFYGL
ncbi:hypothetical protein MA16_Dca020231 [Dendrobium catenatum]|uniref:Uncharacterized protein n=1 Tax=Dendrobium catenatum TaxID=906689 RepID=A0A2I0V8W9_9ASPA|nr:hypothetical protein MA16_Dca020231 [Dendrobium catenatum]